MTASQALILQGFEQGFERGQEMLAEAIALLQSGKTPEELIEQGCDERAVNAALSCIQLPTPENGRDTGEQKEG